MTEISDSERWSALMRGQVMSASIGKLMATIQLVDQKAQVMIFLNSILIPVCISAIESGTYVMSSSVSIVTSVVSILAAVMCIYPKRRYRKIGDPEINLLHFNDIGHMDKQDYVTQFLPTLNAPDKLAEMVVKDIYDTSRYSIVPKFKWLKLSYLTFSVGNLIAIAIVLLEV